MARYRKRGEKILVAHGGGGALPYRALREAMLVQAPVSPGRVLDAREIAAIEQALVDRHNGKRK